MDRYINIFPTRPVLNQVLSLILTILIALIVVVVLLKLLKKVFVRIRTGKNVNNTNSKVLENVIRFIIIFVAVLWVVMSSELTRSFGQTLFTGTAVLAAIAGFAAQPVLSDLICGFILGSTRPLEIGDRVVLDDGIAGIVKDMTLRHVVLQGLDTQTIVVPNSKMNSYIIRNMSYRSEVRSVDFRFSASFRTDPEKAVQVISDAVQASPLSVPGKTGPDGQPAYAGVYFLSFAESSLVFGTTAYYEPSTPTEVFKNDINTRVRKALNENEIEIPYSYVNVVMKQ